MFMDKQGADRRTIPHVLRKVRDDARAGANSLKVTLFKGSHGQICGWFVGPLVFVAGHVRLPFLAQSDEILAEVAVIRAITEAEATRSDICLVDPDDLWDTVWRK